MVIEKLKGENVIVFGAGFAGTSLAYTLKCLGVKLKCCFDNDPSRNCTYIWGDIKVITPNDEYINCVIVSCFYDENVYKTIKKQLTELGYTDFIQIQSNELREMIKSI